MTRFVMFCFTISALFFIPSCGDMGDPLIPINTNLVPVLISVSPDSGKGGDTIVVSGNNFGNEVSGNLISFNGINGFIISWSHSEVQTIVPNNLPIGILQMDITRNNVKSNKLNFKILSSQIIDTTPTPIVSFSIPDSGKKGDTIEVRGTNFGVFDSNSTIRFSSINGVVLIWNDTTIQTIVPQSISSGITQITIIRGIKISNPISFNILQNTVVSFQNDIRPLISSYGCSGCHPGNGNYSVSTHSTIITRVIAGSGNGSLLVQKLRGTASGSRMPVGGPFMNNAEIQTIVNWIDQGAQNN